MKGLEAFRDILGILSAVSGCEVDMNSETIQTIKKELTALNTIINKKVDVGRLFYSNDLDDYNEYIIRSGGGYYTLTPNEYKAIMEVLTYENQL